MARTTFEEFKHIREGPRPRAPACRGSQRDEPNEGGHRPDPPGPPPRYEQHHKVTISDGPSRSRLASPGGTSATRACPTAPSDVIDRGGGGLRLNPPEDGRRVVDAPEVERVVSRMARIPGDRRATTSDRERLRTLDEALKRSSSGRTEAVEQVASAIKRARAGLGPPSAPPAPSLHGPTGWGRSELAKQLARHLATSSSAYDMSEYGEKHSVSRLIGAPPAYVGFEQGGLLVDAVRQHPLLGLLLDESRRPIRT